ncbi:Nramp family divalent metal transporter [Rheinheimera salexigens]|uniref:Manganese transporter n=1 Tax=Rheinheimera salexigens TaxID=1628148 RepID=A0A1E7Q786_9GAMM|nr:Nramp family divalent metal transporter [Rheinheimera salexigens]OEY69908.1 manganese transporter [Rheinheimera salexigens]
MANNNKKTFLGPAVLVTAAFIGPGTVVTASLAGADFGYALVWALVFSVCATMILQEMAARLGIVTGKGLGENLRSLVQHPLLRWPLLLLVTAAIVIGNSAYQGGNITGASMGAETIWGQSAWLQSWSNFTTLNPWALILGFIAASVLWFGKYKVIERCLIVLVLLMSLAFISTMILTKPDILGLLQGAFIPSIPTGATLTVAALIGTSVVPYSLFLHAASSAQKWPKGQVDVAESLTDARRDIVVAIPLGGLISIAIVSTAAAAFFGQTQQLENVSQLAVALEPLFGKAATWGLSLGLLASGLSSAITAPLAAAYAMAGILGKPLDLKQPVFRATWLLIIISGVIFASLGIKPVSVIWFAQVANGILLPLICLCLLLAMNHTILGQYKNNRWQNILGSIVLLISVILSVRSLGLAFNLI